MKAISSVLTTWCARKDLNLHPLPDQILSLACLPFHHARRVPKDAMVDGKLKFAFGRAFP